MRDRMTAPKVRAAKGGPKLRMITARAVRVTRSFMR